MNWPPGSSFDYWQGGLPLFINEPKHVLLRCRVLD